MDPAAFIIAVRDVNVYEYCDYEGRGLLLQVLQESGDKGLAREIRLLSSLMYSDGQGIRIREISEDSWDSWSDQEHQVQEEPKQQQEPPVSGERVVCWKLEYRGSYGESLLHILLICNSDPHTRVAKSLLTQFPLLAHDVFQSPEYYGQSLVYTCNQTLTQPSFSCHDP